MALRSLRSWTDFTDAGVRYFSGTATYETSLPAPKPAAGERVTLDLGAVRHFAQVTVNGRAYPSMWRPPFALDVTDALAGDVLELKVRVTNLWPNRLIGDEVECADDCAWQESAGTRGRRERGIVCRREYFCSYPDRVLVMRFEKGGAETNALDVSVRPWIPHLRPFGRGRRRSRCGAGRRRRSACRTSRAFRASRRKAFRCAGARCAKNGGGGENRTPVRNSFHPVSTRVSRLSVSSSGRPADRLTRRPATTIRQDTGARLLGPRQGLLVVASPLSRHRRFHVGPNN